MRRRKQKRAVRRSQTRRYPDDWVFERYTVTGRPSTSGSTTPSAVTVKFLHAQGADELCPYGCDLDYVMSEAMGSSFAGPRPWPGGVTGVTSDCPWTV